MIDDPIVNEVRETRRKILEQFGGDLGKLLDYLKTREAEHPDRVVTPQQLKELLKARAKTRAK